MEYGLIGEKLGHSFSVEIHNMIADYNYELCELDRADFDLFMKNKNFKAINVTIPYKIEVIPYLDFLDEAAKEIGAVNVIVNKDQRLFGYNSDFFGMKAMLEKTGVNLKGKKCVILGTGGTSKTAVAVLRSIGAGRITVVGRTAKKESVTYDELYRDYTDAEFFINTTPLGMYPKNEDAPIDLSKFPKVIAVADAVYNPLRTKFLRQAEGLLIPFSSGLYMLVAQAVKASEIFLDRSYGEGIIDEIYARISSDKENIVLTGMPSSGKSTVGKILAERLGRRFLDTDSLIEENENSKIQDIFKKNGEGYFRELEREVIAKASMESGLVISTGGGAILNRKNVDALKQNGRIYFLDRPLEKLIPTEDRPLSKDREAIEKRYAERYDVYLDTADVRIDADASPEAVADMICNERIKE